MRSSSIALRAIASCRPSAVLGRCTFTRKELERGLRLGLLGGGKVDALAREERLRHRRDLERLARLGLRREFKGARAVGIQPEFGDERAVELGRTELELEDVDRPHHGKIVETNPLRRVRIKE